MGATMKIDVVVKGQIVVRDGGKERYISGAGVDVSNEAGKAAVDRGLAKPSGGQRKQ